MSTKVKVFSLARYVDAALEQAEYERDESGFIAAHVPDAPGFFSQGRRYEEARENLRDAIEGNVMLILQLGWEVPRLRGVDIAEHDV